MDNLYLNDKHYGACRQFIALVKRNIIIKKREKTKTITEFTAPLYYILILAVIRLFITDTTYIAITDPHDGAKLALNDSALLNGNVFIAPDTPEVHRLVDDIVFLTKTSSHFSFFSSESELELAYKKDQNVSVALVFSEVPITNPSYKIRINPSKTHLVASSNKYIQESQCRTKLDYGLENGRSCPTNSYFDSGFLQLQNAIDLSIIKQTANRRISNVDFYLQSFPRNKFVSAGTMVLRSIIPLYMVFAWAQFIHFMLILIVEEKEKKIKDGMKMMGLMGSVYWLSWVAIYGIYVFLLSIVCIIILPLSKVFRYANLILLFILFMLYGFSSIMLALMITPFFNKAKIAGIVGQLLQVGLGMLFFLQVFLGDSISPVAFWFLGLLSPCAFSFAIDKVIMFDFSDGGLGWNNIWAGEGLPFAGSLIMLSVDILLYLALGYYFDNVIPSEYGTKHKPWFIFKASTWFGSTKSTSNLSSGKQNLLFEEDYAVNNPDIEEISSDLIGNEAVRIRNLSKVFSPKGKDRVTAVNGFSLDIYKGQITAVLGHNGAGKTTLFNILTGLIEPTEGFASIFNMDISEQNALQKIRRYTGVCPQSDILFVKLTPREHLEFYCAIKGVPKNLIKMKVDEMLADVDLSSKADDIAENLSGGQKRKLSIAIALIGDPKIVFLDEPTAGVDPYSRRHLWALCKKMKKDKVIILTTHFMDEADILADRKVIISKGKLRCCGTSVFLKNRFGLGYHLTLVKSDSSSVKEITDIITGITPEAEFVRHFAKEISFLLPVNLAGEFPRLFESLDRYVAASRPVIESYGISMTSLEEVFLALSKDEHDDITTVGDLSKRLLKTRSLSVDSSSSVSASSRPCNEIPLERNKDYMENGSFNLQHVEIEHSSMRSFMALVKLRTLNTVRELGALVFLVVMPLVFLIISMAITNSSTITVDPDEITALNSGFYASSPVNEVLVYNEANIDLTYIYKALEDSKLTHQLYNGSYNYIYESQMHLGAYNFLDPNSRNMLWNLTTLFNSSFAHILPILVNIANNALYRSEIRRDTNLYLNVSSQPLPSYDDAQVSFDFSAYFAPVMIGFVFTMIPAGLVIDIVYDREINARNLLRLNGISFGVYFSSFFSVIGSLYAISYFGLLIIIQAFQVPSLVITPAFITISLLYLIYMPGSMFFSACFSYMYDKQETARQFYPTLATTVGFVTYTIVMFVDLFGGAAIAYALHITFTVVFNFYIPFGALYYINKVYITCSLLGTCSSLTAQDYFTDEIIAMFIVCIINIFLYFGLLLIIDTLKYEGSLKNLFSRKEEFNSPPQKFRPNFVNEDIDVVTERENVYTSLMNCEDDPALLYNIVKEYPKESTSSIFPWGKQDTFKAVKCVSFQVTPGQVMGLLGPNGAGKTSTLKVLTAEEAPTSGQVRLCGQSISSSQSSAFEYLGYCPQHDCIWPNITVSEHIECFANISGIRKDQVKGIVTSYIRGLEIDEHKNKKSKKCSGGTKRKLCYIMSMIGRPKLVLLDEPSTGMDPQSKRFLWNSILSSFKGNRSAILTTHSMEEADALCSRIGILVAGKLKCLGSVQHLKNKYGSGYSLEIKALVDSLEYVKATIFQLFAKATIDEEFEERIIFKIPQEAMSSLGTVFSTMEVLKREGRIEEYALSQTTLEQIFIQFAQKQDEETKDDDTMVELPHTP